jgi:hypothetical protein
MYPTGKTIGYYLKHGFSVLSGEHQREFQSAKARYAENVVDHIKGSHYSNIFHTRM